MNLKVRKLIIFPSYLAVEKFPGVAAANSKVPYLSSFRFIALHTLSKMEPLHYDLGRSNKLTYTRNTKN